MEATRELDKMYGREKVVAERRRGEPGLYRRTSSPISRVNTRPVRMAIQTAILGPASAHPLPLLIIFCKGLISVISQVLP